MKNGYRLQEGYNDWIREATFVTSVIFSFKFYSLKCSIFWSFAAVNVFAFERSHRIIGFFPQFSGSISCFKAIFSIVSPFKIKPLLCKILSISINSIAILMTSMGYMSLARISSYRPGPWLSVIINLQPSDTPIFFAIEYGTFP